MLHTQTNFLIYKVEEGDTVASIAIKNYGRLEDRHFITENNRLKYGKVYPGMTIKLPMGEKVNEYIFR